MHFKKVIGLIVWLFVIVSCGAHSIDYNCPNNQIADKKKEIVNIKVDDTDGEIYLNILLLHQYQGKDFSALYLSQENSRGILVPMKTSKSEDGINSWLIGNKHHLINSELIVHYGEVCPLKVVRRIEIVDQ